MFSFREIIEIIEPLRFIAKTSAILFFKRDDYFILGVQHWHQNLTDTIIQHPIRLVRL